jgi:very-short-patch-repair endonuclease
MPQADGGGHSAAVEEMRAPDRTIKFAKTLRAVMTPPERLLWRHLRLLRNRGVHFRRQHPVGPYVLDFYCAKSQLAVEVDGIAHRMADRPMRDQQRDAWLEAKGVRVYRIEAADVLRDPDEAARGVFIAPTSP